MALLWRICAESYLKEYTIVEPAEYSGFALWSCPFCGDGIVLLREGLLDQHFHLVKDKETPIDEGGVCGMWLSAKVLL